MSTKIFNAFYFKNINNIKDIQENIKKFNKELLPEIQNLFMLNLLNKLVYYFDTIDEEVEYYKIKENDNCYEILSQNISKALTNSNLFLMRDYYNFNFETMLYIKEYNNRIYCKILTENNIILIKLINFFELVDYHYQNQSDKPKDINEADWLERENIWNILLENTYSFQEAGFIPVKLIDFLANLSIMPTEFCFYRYLKNNIDSYLLFDKQQRAVNFCKDYIFNYIIKEQKLKVSQYLKIKNINNSTHKFHSKYLELYNFIIEQFLLYAPNISIDNFEYTKINLNVWSKSEMNEKIYNKVNEINFNELLNEIRRN